MSEVEAAKSNYYFRKKVTKTRKSEQSDQRSAARRRPLSKYRRKTANAKERERMREINNAFHALRNAVPGGHVAKPEKGERQTKLNILKLAMNYIEALSEVLETLKQNNNNDEPGETSDDKTEDVEDSCKFLSSSQSLDLKLMVPYGEYELLTEEDFTLSTVITEPPM